MGARPHELARFGASAVALIVDIVFCAALNGTRHFDPPSALAGALITHAVLSAMALVGFCLAWQVADKQSKSGRRVVFFLLLLELLLVVTLSLAFAALFQRCNGVGGLCNDEKGRTQFVKIMEWVFVVGMAVVMSVYLMGIAVALSFFFFEQDRHNGNGSSSSSSGGSGEGESERGKRHVEFAPLSGYEHGLPSAPPTYHMGP